MKSPLSIDQATIKEFGITSEVDLEPQMKAAYIRAQLDEMKKMLFRARVDIILSEKLMESDIEVLAEKGRANRTDNRHTVKQMTGAVETLQVLLAELEDVKS